MSSHQPDPNNWEESPRLPPGFRFHPTDEELVSYYLTQKVQNSNIVFEVIGEVDFNKCEPWDLPAKAKLGHESILYFFNLRDRKYPTGVRTNRASEAGYWKATGKDREVIAKCTGTLLGMKKTLVFYMGRAPKGEKTNWIMHEYRLEGEPKPYQQEWVVSRVFQKSVSTKRTLPESTYNAADDGEYSTDDPCSFLPALHNLESRNSHSVHSNSTSNIAGQTFGESQAYFRGAVFPGHGTVWRSNSSMKERRELQLADTLENLVSGWDMGSPLPIWEVGAGP